MSFARRAGDRTAGATLNCRKSRGVARRPHTRGNLDHMKLSRRKLAAVALASVAAPLAAQTQAAQSAPHDLNAELQAARERIKANGEKLAQQPIAMTVEPAVTFRA
jgi:hypothetical protein